MSLARIRAALLQHPPFRISTEMHPATVAGAIVGAFDALAATPAPLLHAYDMAMQVTNVAPGHPLRRAGMAAAWDIDAGIGAGLPHGYHNARHYCEVLLCALAIGQLAALAWQEQALLLLAALLHDFHHDGGKRLYPFHHELCSLEAASPYLDRAGIAATDRAVLATRILSTESACGVPPARCCHDWPCRRTAGRTLLPAQAGGGAAGQPSLTTLAPTRIRGASAINICLVR